ncbi:MAG: hypothetical protein R3301_16575 [Saprospiraceae bacterium]|nr:hypothetical protein [Saprospiraceae bacterium]
MKRVLHWTSLVILAMLIQTGTSLASQVEGLWHNERTGISIEVQDTYDGIKVKRTDASRWRYYDTRSNDIYSDQRGNYYELRRRNQLRWVSRNGRDVLVFTRASSGWYDDDEETWYGGAFYDNYDDGLGGFHADGSYCPGGYLPHQAHQALTRSQVRKLRGLEGRWSGWRGQGIMEIRVNRKAVHVDYNGRHFHFYPTGNGRLAGDNGMSILTTGRNRLILRGHRGRPLAFTRGRYNDYCY